MRSLRVSLPAIAAALLVVASTSTGIGEPSKEKTAWKITGELEESCSCNGACPCWFGNKPTRMNCSGGQAIFIKKGHYGNVPLDGLALAEWVQSPDGKTMMESIGHWNFSHVYLDSKASPEQREALEAIADQVLPPIEPERRTIRATTIFRKIDGREHVVTVGPNMKFSAHLYEGGDNGPPRIVNPPFADPIHKEYMQGLTTHHTYDDGVQWDFSNTNYMYNEFTTSSADYEKFALKMSGAANKK